MQIAIVGAGFDPSEADRLRRLAGDLQQATENVGEFRARFHARHARERLRRSVRRALLFPDRGFGAYGFPNTHTRELRAARLCPPLAEVPHHPAFRLRAAQLPAMGFYAPAQIVRDAREHGVEVRPVCINASYWTT